VGRLLRECISKLLNSFFGNPNAAINTSEQSRMFECISRGMTRWHVLLGLRPNCVLVPVHAKIVQLRLYKWWEDPINQIPVGFQ
jgi:hypothetical protein